MAMDIEGEDASIGAPNSNENTVRLLRESFVSSSPERKRTLLSQLEIPAAIKWLDATQHPPLPKLMYLGGMRNGWIDVVIALPLLMPFYHEVTSHDLWKPYTKYLARELKIPKNQKDGCIGSRDDIGAALHQEDTEAFFAMLETKVRDESFPMFKEVLTPWSNPALESENYESHQFSRRLNRVTDSFGLPVQKETDSQTIPRKKKKPHKQASTSSLPDEDSDDDDNDLASSMSATGRSEFINVQEQEQEKEQELKKKYTGRPDAYEEAAAFAKHLPTNEHIASKQLDLGSCLADKTNTGKFSFAYLNYFATWYILADPFLFTVI
jgi:hypothetical protein